MSAPELPVDVVVRLVGPRGPVELYPLRLESGPFPPGTGPLEFALARALLEEATRHVTLVRPDPLAGHVPNPHPCPRCGGKLCDLDD